MKVTISDARQLQSGIWIASVSENSLRHFTGRGTDNGGKNVVVVNRPEFSPDGNLSFALGEARIVNRATNQETLFVENGVGNVAVQGVSVLTHVEGTAAMVYWVTVASGAQENLQRGLCAGVWGVKDEFRSHLEAVAKGSMALFYGRDIGFTLCRIESDPYIDKTPIWPDGSYPHRVKISAPIAAEANKRHPDVYGCLRDKDGQRFRNEHAEHRGISSHGGTFRRLSPIEVNDLFGRLGWRIEGDGTVKSAS